MMTAGSAAGRRVRAFLEAIGIGVTIEPGANGFLDHIRIVDGILRVDPGCPVGDVLHEAGHLAVTPARWRKQCQANMDEMVADMFADLRALGEHPDSPLSRAAMQGGEQEAIAWAWSAGVHLRLMPNDIIIDAPYAFEGFGNEVRACLAARDHPGISGLAHAGFCSTNGLGGKPRYPKLAFWTQEAA